jgi:peptidoglycan-associated lipoprotein
VGRDGQTEPEPEPEPKNDEPDPEPEPVAEPEPEPAAEPAFVKRTEAQPVEEPKSAPTEPAFVKRTEAQVVEQEKEEELIVEEKDADESVQPPKAEEIMILPPEETDTAFSEMGMIYFAYDKSEITAEFQEVIQKNYEWIFQNPDAQIQLEGHCDERGTNEYNLALGERRAKAVFDYLVSLGASPSQFTIVSFGEERPVAYGSSEASWRQNRRVEFTRL